MNNVIGNEEEELAYRESEVETLTAELKKVSSVKIEAEARLEDFARYN